MKLGSLFDGSGGFPLAGSLCGITPVWAAEVEPYPIAVTRSRFPDMRHLGDISEVNGAEIEPVDVLTFGSPCQDLSTAGKRAGLKHADNGDEETTRSGLFMEAVRIIKEMRKATNGVYPRIALWENVPGAFSSNKGEDFRAVLQELIKIVEPAAIMPAVPKNGWPYADHYCGDGWSLAYRLFDAQYWPGTPQRRQRIHLVVDFTGQCARNILFEREGLRGDFTPCSSKRESAAAYAKECAGEPGGPAAFRIGAYYSAGMLPSNPNAGIIPTSISNTLDCNGGAPTSQQGGTCIVEPVPYTLKIRSGCEGGGKGPLVQTNKSATLKTCNDQYLFQPVSAGFKAGAGAKAHSIGYKEERAPTLTAQNSGTNQVPAVVCGGYIVRRLTPTECARLQGFADDWGHIKKKESFTPEEYLFWLRVRNTHAKINGKRLRTYTEKQMLTWYNKLHTDGAEYKMWGNGIALPPALYCMQGIADALGGVTE